MGHCGVALLLITLTVVCGAVRGAALTSGQCDGTKEVCSTDLEQSSPAIPEQPSSRNLVIDCFPYNGELITAFRLSYLDAHVDLFVITEARKTFSGVRKAQLFLEIHGDIFKPYLHKIKFLIIDDFPDSVDPEWYHEHSRRYQFMSVDFNSWYREWYQREYPVNFLRRELAGKQYLVVNGDVDEIPRTSLLERLSDKALYSELDAGLRLEMDFFYYNFHWLKPTKWYKATIVNDRSLQSQGFSAYRMGEIPIPLVIQNAGWHFSYFSSYEDIVRKIESFSHREFDRADLKDRAHIGKCLTQGLDLFRRGEAESLYRNSDFKGLPRGWEDFSMTLSRLQLKDVIL